jgi:gliding motility-associated-like protein
MKKIPVIGSPNFRIDQSGRCGINRLGKLYFAWVIFFLICFLQPAAQCPVNLGFESGDFSNWQCFAGMVDARGNATTSVTGPLKTRHTMYQNSFPQELDPYGKFPVNSPNGSSRSIRLGNDSIDGQIDGVSYTLTVPAGKNDYSIVYNYAVVFQDPGHIDLQQPHFTAKVFDVSANQYIDCSSFDFSASAKLPGFKKAEGVAANSAVYYKPWSPISIKLLGYAGKTIKIEFTVTDCTLGAHFGYAYLDINEDCGDLIGGSVVCAGRDETLLVAPYGFKDYTWYNSDFSRILGTGNTLRLKPLPVTGTRFALEIIPYPGSGCKDTLYTTMRAAPVPFVFTVADSAGACLPNTVDISSSLVITGASQGLKYLVFTDSTLVEYAATPKQVSETGTYYIKATNEVGCLDVKPVVVVMDTIPVVTVNEPNPESYPKTVDITNPALINGDITGLRFYYWKDAATSLVLPNPRAVSSGGIYYIEARTKFGCSVVNPIEVSIQIATPPNIFTPNNDGVNDRWEIPSLNSYLQCRVDIYDRYGRIVFHSTGYDQPWDGTINGNPLPIGTYYYIIKVSDKLALISGSVTILR